MLQVHCATHSHSDLNTAIDEDEHSIGKLRINGALSNFGEFAEVFACPLGSPMNRKDKCQSW